MIGTKSKAISLILRKLITSKRATLALRNFHPDRVSNAGRNEKDEASPALDVQNKSKDSSAYLDKVHEYFKEIDLAGLAEVLPPKVIKQQKSKPDHLYLFEESVAEEIVHLFKDELASDSKGVIEMNAGLGILTEKLLTAGVPSVAIMEPSFKFAKYLAQLEGRYSDRVTVQEADLTNIWKLAYRDKQDEGDRVRRLLSAFPYVRWGEEVGFKVVGSLTSMHFIRHMLLDTIKQSGLVSYGRPCLYLAIPPSIWKRLTCSHTVGGEYRSMTVLFQLFYDYRLLGQVPRKAYLPWLSSYVGKKSIRRTRNLLDKDVMYVVKIEGKKNLFTDIIEPERIQPLWYFVSHHMTARTGRVIPQMEAWQPGCGPTLIMQDINIFTQFGDLSPQELLKLFKIFASWHGYQHSFLPSLENSLQKMDQLLF